MVRLGNYRAHNSRKGVSGRRSAWAGPAFAEGPALRAHKPRNGGFSDVGGGCTSEKASGLHVISSSAFPAVHVPLRQDRRAASRSTGAVEEKGIPRLSCVS